LVSSKQENIEQVMNVNLIAPMLISRAVAKHMLRHPKTVNKSIVNVGSVVGSCGNVGQTVYGASKAGLVGLTKSLAKELGSR
jgi:NAD(P)-dependent dehydrogenase (short-subunit alcohol dehydrogenase family)